MQLETGNRKDIKMKNAFTGHHPHAGHPRLKYKSIPSEFIWEYTYHVAMGTTMSDLARRTKLSRPTVYRYAKIIDSVFDKSAPEDALP